MAITVKHKFVSAIPDAGDTTIVQPSNWNDDHQLVGTVPVANGGTGASTLTGYVKGTGTTAMTAATTIPNTDITGLGTASTKDAGVANGVATLDSSGTVPLSQIPALGDLNYQGTWNATTNSPTLTSSVGTKGFYYVVSVAGTTNLNGITDWQIGDWAVYNGSVWQKIDNTDAVTSVNGYTGTVVLTQTDISGTVPTSRTITAGTGLTGGGDLSANRTLAIATTGVSATTYGSASSVPVIAVNTQGQITSATNTNIAIANTAVSGLGTMSTQNANAVAVTGGTINGTTIGATSASTGAFTYLSTSSSTNITPTLSFNGSNSPIASGATIPNSYLQFILQNKSGTAGASTNYVLSNDLGTDSSYYGEFGMNSSVYSAGTPADFFSINNGIYYSGHDGDITVGSGNGYKTYIAWGTTGQSAHVINASGAIGLNTSITGTTNFGTSGQVLTSAGNAATPTWATPTTGTVTSVSGTGTVSGISLSGTVTSSGNLTLGGTLDLSSPPTIGNTAPNTGKFTTLESTGTASLGTASTTYIRAIGDASYPGVYATGGTNTPLVLSPLGTGALQAQKTDSTATGGNARGANAVDWQTSRSTAAQVASGIFSFIGGGSSNTASLTNSVVAGGNANSANGSNTAVLGGNTNLAATYGAAIVGGLGNTAGGYYNFIGAGYTNSATSASVVTTNTATIANAGTTTFYLSSANANIKVGQLIVGTGVSSAVVYATSTVTTGTAAVMATSSIAVTTGILTVGTLSSGTIVAGQVLTGTGVPAGTYIVSNISGSGSGSTWNTNITTAVASTTITGTAYTFTISQAATTAAGVTLSFYTPHGVVVGGGNNQATGAYSFIGGGGDAGTAANRNSAAGDWSVVVGGYINTVNSTSSNSFIGSGNNNSITTSANSVICGGTNNSAQSGTTFIGGGTSNLANGAFSAIMGGYDGTTRAINGFQGFPACVNPLGTFTVGGSQAGLLVIAKITTDATPTVLTSTTAAAGTANQVILPNNSAYYFKARIISGVTGAGNTKAWTIEGAIKRGAGVGTTAIVGTVTTTVVAADAGAATWAIAATADTTNGGLAITFTGQAATTIRTVCKVETVEMTF